MLKVNDEDDLWVKLGQCNLKDSKARQVSQASLVSVYPHECHSALACQCKIRNKFVPAVHDGVSLAGMPLLWMQGFCRLGVGRNSVSADQAV